MAYAPVLKTAIEVLGKGLIPLKPGPSMLMAIKTAAELQREFVKFDSRPNFVTCAKALKLLTQLSSDMESAVMGESRGESDEDKEHLKAVTTLTSNFLKVCSAIESKLKSDYEKIKLVSSSNMEDLLDGGFVQDLFERLCKKESAEMDFKMLEYINGGHANKVDGFLKIKNDLVKRCNIGGPTEKLVDLVDDNTPKKDFDKTLKEVTKQLKIGLVEVYGRGKEWMVTEALKS